jgi:hypothetical protein
MGGSLPGRPEATTSEEKAMLDLFDLAIVLCFMTLIVVAGVIGQYTGARRTRRMRATVAVVFVLIVLPPTIAPVVATWAWPPGALRLGLAVGGFLVCAFLVGYEDGKKKRLAKEQEIADQWSDRTRPTSALW